MEMPFVFDHYVTGKNFIGRRQERNILSNLILAGENVYMAEQQGSGKTSLLRQTLTEMGVGSKVEICVAEFSALMLRSPQSFLNEYIKAVYSALSLTPETYKTLVSEHLQGTNWVFDESRFHDQGEVLSQSWELDKEDYRVAISLPYLIATQLQKRLLIVIEDFNCILNIADSDILLKTMEKACETYSSSHLVSHIFIGSMVNAMEEIFCRKRYFYRHIERLNLGIIPVRDVADFLVRKFSVSGKVVDKGQLGAICELFKGNMRYITQFAAFCDYISKGYITEGIMTESLNWVLSMQMPRFVMQFDDLTTFQVGLLKAVLDGCSKYSSSEAVQKYGLNSSANVKRLKDALMKKEILIFHDDDSAEILDPLFEWWIRNKRL